MLDPDLTQDSVARLWAVEYESAGLPSSVRQEPSGAVRDFLRLARDLRMDPEKSSAVDVGCGTGRNTLYLAEAGFRVYAIDIVPALIAKLRERSREVGLEPRIDLTCQSVTETWPIPDSACDVSIDTFCYKHLIEASARTAYHHELRRVVRTGGLYLLTLAATQDGYYGILPYRTDSTGARIVKDPENRIDSVIYDVAHIQSAFAEEFTIIHHQEKRKLGPMHGTMYGRVTHVLVLQRR